MLVDEHTKVLTNELAKAAGVLGYHSYFAADIFVLGGLPVTVVFAPLRDQRNMDEIIYLTRKGKRADWVAKRVAETRGEEERVVEAIYDSNSEFTREPERY